MGRSCSGSSCGGGRSGHGEEAEKLVREAIVMYVDDLKERGLPIPVRASKTRTIGHGEQFRHHKE